MTKSVCLSASDTLAVLTRDLEPGERAEFRDQTGVHMTLFVSRLVDRAAGSLFTIAHAHAGHLGQLIPDPSVIMLRSLDGSWIPLEISTPFAHVVTTEAGDQVRVVLRDEHWRLVKLTEVWMATVRAGLMRQYVPEGRETSSPVADAAGWGGGSSQECSWRASRGVIERTANVRPGYLSNISSVLAVEDLDLVANDSSL